MSNLSYHPYFCGLVYQERNGGIFFLIFLVRTLEQTNFLNFRVTCGTIKVRSQNHLLSRTGSPTPTKRNLYKGFEIISLLFFIFTLLKNSHIISLDSQVMFNKKFQPSWKEKDIFNFYFDIILSFMFIQYLIFLFVCFYFPEEIE